jgi:hypothetical protein
MVVELIMVNEVAATPPKLTAVVVDRFVPVIVTVPPAPVIFGVKDESVGSGMKVKPGLDAVPAAVTSDTSPEFPPPTIAEIDVEELTVKLALAPPNLTPVISEKFVPVIVTLVPLAPVVGVKELIVGNIPKPLFEADPPGVITVIFPDVPEPTTALMVVGETTVKDTEGVPPKDTAVAPFRFVPVIVTVSPLLAPVGEKEVIVGGGIKLKPLSEPIP